MNLILKVQFLFKNFFTYMIKLENAKFSLYYLKIEREIQIAEYDWMVFTVNGATHFVYFNYDIN